MKEVEIPGGKALFLEPPGDAIAVRGEKALASAAMSLQMHFPGVNFGLEEGETSEAQRARIDAAVSANPFSPAQFLAILASREAAVVATLKSWTLPRALPTMETIDMLDSDLYEALTGAVNVVDLAPPDFSPNPEPIDPATGEERPTGGSTDSDTP